MPVGGRRRFKMKVILRDGLNIKIGKFVKAEKVNNEAEIKLTVDSNG